jgi:hypothetical protein
MSSRVCFVFAKWAVLSMLVTFAVHIYVVAK